MKKVLIVEESRNVTLMISKCLTAHGFLIEQASDGVEAIVKIFDAKPDIILLSIALPKLSGFTICEAVRSNERLDNIIIAMGTNAHEGESKSILEAGANEYISKPFTPKELIGLIQKYIIGKE